MKPFFLLVLLFILGTGCASRKIKDLRYTTSEPNTLDTSELLNVFTPRKATTEKRPVIIFVHGGYWEEGDKNTYGFLGRHFAKYDVVTVIPNYTLSPNANYDGMVQDVVNAFHWTQAHIEAYGGDANQIYLMGHSAGGHLIALMATNPKYDIDKSAIKGVILNDAAGLDMKTYLEQYPPTAEHHFDVTWTESAELWKDASPVYFVDHSTPPFLIYIGEKTYPSIKTQNNAFLDALNVYQPSVQPIILNKKHVGMMSHYIFPWVHRYKEILEFMGN